MRSFVMLLAIGLAVAGCASLTLAPTGDRRIEMLLPLTLALEERPAALVANATAGNPTAQYALSIAQTYGLRGAAVDLDTAAVWRAAAFSAQTTRRVGVGQGRVVNLPSNIIIPYQQMVVDGCVAHLEGIDPDPKWCGSAAEAAVLSEVWRNARSK